MDRDLCFVKELLTRNTISEEIKFMSVCYGCFTSVNKTFLESKRMERVSSSKSVLICTISVLEGKVLSTKGGNRRQTITSGPN